MSRGSPRRSRTAKAWCLCGDPMKAPRACETGGWGRRTPGGTETIGLGLEPRPPGLERVSSGTVARGNARLIWTRRRDGPRGEKWLVWRRARAGVNCRAEGGCRKPASPGGTQEGPSGSAGLAARLGKLSDGMLGALETSGSCDARSVPLPYLIGAEANAAASARTHEDSRGRSA
jgi:hypothetical protein